MEIRINKIDRGNASFDGYEWILLEKGEFDGIDFDILTTKSFIEVGDLDHLSLIVLVDWWESYLFIWLHNLAQEQEKIGITIEYRLDLENWNKPWSVTSLAEEFKKSVQMLSKDNIEYIQEDEIYNITSFGIKYNLINQKANIKSEVDALVRISENLLEKSIATLVNSLDEEAVLVYFRFPEEFKTACQQYLIYFSQFLADMGIFADTELKEELNHTLFKVIPKDKSEGLDKIREALSIYLKAPTDKNFRAGMLNETEIAVRQWEANILHLKSQLSLAASIIQAKDATIESLQLSNYQFKQLAFSDSSQKDLEKEDVIKGILAVNKYEGKGFTIDFAELFRRLKRIIKK